MSLILLGKSYEKLDSHSINWSPSLTANSLDLTNKRLNTVPSPYQ